MHAVTSGYVNLSRCYVVDPGELLPLDDLPPDDLPLMERLSSHHAARGKCYLQLSRFARDALTNHPAL